jgi:hypothetical protein
MRRPYPTRSPPGVRAPGCANTAGASLLLAPLPAERAWGRNSAGTKGAQGPMSGERSSPKAKPGGRSGEAWPSFRSVPCADDCRCYASAPRALPYRSISRARNPITEMLSPSTVQQGTEVRQRPLGYSDIRMTLAICTHATDEMQDAATAALESAFN